MARRIAAVLLLDPALDASYETVSQAAAPWTSSVGARWVDAPPGL